MIYKVKSIEKTCNACPSQWEGLTEDGKYIYIRYRHGEFSAAVDSDEDSAVLGKEDVYLELDNGEGYGGGLMGSEQMIELTKDLLDFSGCKTEC